MNAASITKGLVRLACLGALTGVTVLLTLLFSFLGNLSCAVVSGMIFGSGRRWQWSALPVSLVFPVVILLMTHYSKVELPAAKVNYVALVTCGAFWGVMVMTFSLRHFERKPEQQPIALEDGVVGASSDVGSPPFNASTLQGSWTSEASTADGALRSKTLRIKAGRFVLVEHSPRGRDRVLAQGGIQVNQTKVQEVIFEADPPSEAK